jgi:hypothetical protein
MGIEITSLAGVAGTVVGATAVIICICARGARERV